MIARVWRGWTLAEQADRYDRHYRSEVVGALRGVPGFRGARLLRRTVGRETEFVSLTFFDDLEAVRGSSGTTSGCATTRPRSRSEQRPRHVEDPGSSDAPRPAAGRLRTRR
jgi:heme-degrading monooxygenase HmoA